MKFKIAVVFIKAWMENVAIDQLTSVICTKFKLNIFKMFIYIYIYIDRCRCNIIATWEIT